MGAESRARVVLPQHDLDLLLVPGVSFVQHADWAGWLIDKEMGEGERRQRVREREGCCKGHDPGRLGVELSNLGKGPGSPLSTAFLLVWGLACVS